MDWLLAGQDPMLEALRNQYATATVTEREFSGAGFFTSFAVDPSIPKFVPPDFTFGDVHIDLVGLAQGAGAVLFVRDGVVDFLECFTYADDWPPTLQLISIRYGPTVPGTEMRDLDWIRRDWQRSSCATSESPWSWLQNLGPQLRRFIRR